MNDLNLFIATQIEPKPKWSVKALYDLSMLSDGMAWTSDSNAYRHCDCDDCETRRVWQPRDFRTDPAAILMLMERMLQEGYEITLMRGWPGCSIDLELGLMYLPRVTAPTTGNAIALAFARAHGYKETE